MKIIPPLVLITLYALLSFIHCQQASLTSDELAHLPAGCSYWHWGDFRLNPEHPPFIKQLAALPVVLWPGLLTWAEDRSTYQSFWAGASIKRYWNEAILDIDKEWFFGFALLYGMKDPILEKAHVPEAALMPTTVPLTPKDFLNDPDKIVLVARIPMILLGIALAALIFHWAYQLFGYHGALLSLGLFCWDPGFIAHSGLVTTDVGVSLFIFASLYFFWRTSRSVTLGNFAGLSICVGLALATKFSAILLLPMLVVLGGIRILDQRPWLWQRRNQVQFAGWRSKLLAFCVLLLGVGLVSFVLIWGVYGFRYAAVRPGNSPTIPRINEAIQLPILGVVQRTAANRMIKLQYPEGNPPPDVIKRALEESQLNLMDRTILLFSRYHLMPEAFVYGLANLRYNSFWRRSFLFQKISYQGFTSYFIWTFLLKTPILSMIIIGFAIFSAFSWKGISRYDRLVVLIPVIIYMGVSLTSTINLGQRHIFPIYPFLFLLCGGLISRQSSLSSYMASKRFVLPLLLAGLAISSTFVFSPPLHPSTIFPHYLAYFNEFAGGPREGYQSLVDSNLDWGQDLKNLRDWLVRHKISEPINLSYSGNADPRYYGILHYKMPGGFQFSPPFQPDQVSFQKAVHPGYLAISATNLQGVFLNSQDRLDLKNLLKTARFIDTIGYSIFLFALD